MPNLKNKIIEGLHKGSISNERLPKELYFKTADAIKSTVYNGFKSYLNKAKGEKLDLLIDLRENVYMFSAAKTFQNISEMSDALINDDGKVLSLSEYKEVAGNIYDKYNKDWIEAEAATAEVSARSANQWVDIEKQGDEYPYLIYAVDEETACDICQPLDGIALPIDDPFWDENATPQHFHCNCTIGQLDENDIKEIKGVSTPDEVSEALAISKKDKSDLFDFNPGKDKVIFQDTGKGAHPYFDVPDKYKDFAADNFGLPIPEND